MSKSSIRSAFKEDKFNLKTIVVIIILVDIYMIPLVLDYDLWRNYFYLILYQAGIIVALLFGLRGQGKFKAIMMNLESIARDKDLSTDVREHRLVMSVHHHFLELGYIYQERNFTYGIDPFKKKRKKTEEVIKD